MAFLMAAAVAFVGSAILLKAGRIPQLTGGATVTGQPGTLLLAIVILLGLTGVLLLAIAGKELLDARHRSHVH
jgi:hypothetical protein